MLCRQSLVFLRFSLTCRRSCAKNSSSSLWRNFSTLRCLGVNSTNKNIHNSKYYNSSSPGWTSVRTMCSGKDSKGAGLRNSPPFSLMVEDDQLSVSGYQKQTMKFYYVWLRDHCQCTKCLTPIVNQREIDIMKIPLDIKPAEVSLDANKLLLRWDDDHQTVFDLEWLSQHSYGTASDERKEIHLWDGSFSQNIPPPISYEKIMHNEKDVLRALELILKYGLVFVNGVPKTAKGTDDVVSHMCESVMETFYGKINVFTSNQEFADTAYSSDAIGGHNDTTYFTESIGLQTFHCHFHDGTGGENLLIDTFHAAEILRQKNPEAFQILTTTPINFHYLDDCRHFKALSPVIRLHPLTKSILQVRYNNADRGNLNTLPHEDVPGFYKALQEFVSILQQSENELWIKLQPGTMVLLDNWRVMHGRRGFTGKRIMCSSYVARDNFLSKIRYLRNKLES